MKISIISDTHFGYKWGTDREEDSFRNALEAFERSKDSDIILLPGDIFDNKIPKQEVLDKASTIFSKAMEGERTVETERGEVGIHGNGVPIVAIHGTHERRPEDYTNPVELMSKTGHLHHLDDEKIVFQKNSEKLAIHGMSGVPERYAASKLLEFSPEPVEDAFNILMIHQSIEGFVYTDDKYNYLSLEQLPEGFDLIINGHIHWYNIERFPGEKPLVLPGSTVTTQMRKIEAEKPKGFLELNTKKQELEFKELESPRKVHYVQLETGENTEWRKIKKKAVEKLEKISGKDSEKPLVNLKIKGQIEDRINPREIKKKFHNQMFLNINPPTKKKITGETKNREIQRKNPWEEGKKILAKKISGEDLETDTDKFLQLLESGETEKALKILEDEVGKV